MKHFSFLSSANRWWSLSAAHPSGHCQDPVNQVRARPENLQLHSDVEECWRRVRRVSAKIHLLPTGSLCCGFTNTQLKTFDKISQKKKVCLSGAATVQLHETNKWKPSFFKVSICPPPPSSLHDGQSWSTLRESFTWYHEDSSIYIPFVYWII